MLTFLFVLLCLCIVNAKLPYHGFDISKRYEPTWESLDKRPLPKWYDEAKIGIFIHWGVFSVPSFGSEWFWFNWKGKSNAAYVDFMKKNYPPNFTYQDFAKDFTAQFYDPQRWAELFMASGARYVVFTSKHHEGYTLWPSKNAFSWNVMDVGPKRNVLGEFAEAIRNFTDLKLGLYHSLYEWFNPLYMEDSANGFLTNNFVRTKTVPELYDLVNTYRPEVLWSDGEWEASDDYWTSKEFLAWLYNDSPVKNTVVTNDRWGKGTLCKHGGFYTCQDRYNPGVLQPHKWENCLTIDKRSWGFRRNAALSDYMTINELIKTLIETVSCGGNFLLNVGPTKDGIITPIYEERLQQLGSWLSINGEAIYYSKPSAVQKDKKTEGVWYTQRGEYLYATVLYWPRDEILTLYSVPLDSNLKVYLLGYSGENNDTKLKIQITNDSVIIKFPPQSKVRSQWAYVLKILCCNYFSI